LNGFQNKSQKTPKKEIAKHKKFKRIILKIKKEKENENNKKCNKFDEL
jgi:hypothetical protein